MSVFRRPGSPYYYAEFQIAGQRFLRSTRRTTEREARAEERRLRAETAATINERRGREALNLDEGFGKYWEEHGHKLRWASEVERYIKQILRIVNATILIENLTDADVNDFVQARVTEGAGEYAINRALSIWRAMHRRARKKWKQRTQEIDWTDFFNPETKRVRFITLEEARRLMEVLPPRLAIAVEWSLYTGCREDETFSLVWDDVHLDRGYATVVAKGGKIHTVWLSPQTLDLLGRVERRGRYVFDRTNKRRAFNSALTRAGIEDFCWHDLRHTHATWLRQAGAPVEVVQRSLGHADIATTMRYAHVDDSELREAMRQLPSIGTSTPKILGFNPLKAIKKN